MKRFARLLLTLCAAISVLLCVAVCVAWVRGRSSADWFHWTRTGEHEWRRETLVAGRDGVYVSHLWFYFDEPGRALTYATGIGETRGLSHEKSDPQRNPYSGTFWNRLGFGMEPARLSIDFAWEGPYRYVFSHAHVPYWFVLIVLSSPCWLWLARARARRLKARRARLGRCRQCGYDLRASPERCPECGAECGAERGTSIPREV